MIILIYFFKITAKVFLAGLNEQVTKAASILGRNVPGKSIEIQIMLLQLLGYIITKKPYTIHKIPIADHKSKNENIEPNQTVSNSNLYLLFIVEKEITAVFFE